MQCPYCGNEMQDGVISLNTRYKTVWKSNDASKEIKKIIVAPDSFGHDEMNAAFCSNCKKMVLDLRDLKEQEALFVFMKDHDDILTR